MNWMDGFEDWVECKGANAAPALKLIAEWKISQVNGLKRTRRNWASSCMGRFDDLSAGLARFKRWLESNTEVDACMVLAWTAQYEQTRLYEYLETEVRGFLVDPPDTDFQRGFLAAVLLIAKEAAGLPTDASPYAEAHFAELTRHPDKRGAQAHLH